MLAAFGSIVVPASPLAGSSPDVPSALKLNTSKVGSSVRSGGPGHQPLTPPFLDDPDACSDSTGESCSLHPLRHNSNHAWAVGWESSDQASALSSLLGSNASLQSLDYSNAGDNVDGSSSSNTRANGPSSAAPKSQAAQSAAAARAHASLPPASSFTFRVRPKSPFTPQDAAASSSSPGMSAGTADRAPSTACSNSSSVLQAPAAAAAACGRLEDAHAPQSSRLCACTPQPALSYQQREQLEDERVLAAVRMLLSAACGGPTSRSWALLQRLHVHACVLRANARYERHLGPWVLAKVGQYRSEMQLVKHCSTSMAVLTAPARSAVHSACAAGLIPAEPPALAAASQGQLLVHKAVPLRKWQEARQAHQHHQQQQQQQTLGPASSISGGGKGAASVDPRSSHVGTSANGPSLDPRGVAELAKHARAMLTLGEECVLPLLAWTVRRAAPGSNAAFAGACHELVLITRYEEQGDLAQVLGELLQETAPTPQWVSAPSLPRTAPGSLPLVQRVGQGLTPSAMPLSRPACLTELRATTPERRRVASLPCALQAWDEVSAAGALASGRMGLSTPTSPTGHAGHQAPSHAAGCISTPSSSLHHRPETEQAAAIATADAAESGDSWAVRGADCSSSGLDPASLWCSIQGCCSAVAASLGSMLSATTRGSLASSSPAAPLLGPFESHDAGAHAGGLPPAALRSSAPPPAAGAADAAEACVLPGLDMDRVELLSGQLGAVHAVLRVFEAMAGLLATCHARGMLLCDAKLANVVGLSEPRAIDLEAAMWLTHQPAKGRAPSLPIPTGAGACPQHTRTGQLCPRLLLGAGGSNAGSQPAPRSSAAAASFLVTSSVPQQQPLAGWVVQYDNTAANRRLWTLRYAAPEQLKASAPFACPASDVHALGASLHESLSRARLMGRLGQAAGWPGHWAAAKALSALADACVHEEWRQRPSAGEVLSALQGLVQAACVEEERRRTAVALAALDSAWWY